MLRFGSVKDVICITSKPTTIFGVLYQHMSNGQSARFIITSCWLASCSSIYIYYFTKHFHRQLLCTMSPLPNYKADARRVADVLLSDGIAIIPTEQGYGLLASDPSAIDRSFEAKNRSHGHPLGIIGNYRLSCEIHVIPDRHREMIRIWNQELDMPIGVVAPYRSDHPMIKRLGDDVLAKHTKNGTLAMFVGGPPLLQSVVDLVAAEGRLVLGSSANLTGSGQKFMLEDVEEAVKDAADIIIDYGLQRAHVYGVGTMNIDFENIRVIRFGSCYEMFRDYMQRFWSVDLPEGPPIPQLPPEAKQFQYKAQ